MTKNVIVPAVLAHTQKQLFEGFAHVAKLRPMPHKVHVDIADGVHVGHTTYPFVHGDSLTELDCLPQNIPHGVQVSVHCMVAHPERVVPVYIRAGVSEVCLHVESFSDIALLETCCAMWSVRGAHVVLAKYLTTPVQRLVECMERTHIDKVLLLSILYAGKQGSPFDRHIVTHMNELLRLYPSAHICIDGGVRPKHIAELCAHGAKEIIVGSYVMHAEHAQRAYDELRSEV
jgi:pentose-5-phosphate-3-epimerase